MDQVGMRGLSIASLRLAPASKHFKVQGATFQENNGSRGTEAVICRSTAAHLALWRLQGLKVGKSLQFARPGDVLGGDFIGLPVCPIYCHGSHRRRVCILLLPIRLSKKRKNSSSNFCACGEPNAMTSMPRSSIVQAHKCSKSVRAFACTCGRALGFWHDDSQEILQ